MRKTLLSTALWLLVVGPAAAGAPLRALSGPRGTVHALSFSRDGGLLAAASDVLAPPASGGPSAPKIIGGEIRVWDAATGSLRLTLPTPAPLLAAALSPDGATVAAPDPEGIALYDAETGAKTQTLSGDLKSVDSLAYSRDGKLLVSRSSEDRRGEIRVRTAEGAFVASFASSDGPFSSVSLSGDGTTLAAAVGKEIRVWDVAKASLKRTIRVEEDELKTVSLSLRGEWLAAPVVPRLKVWSVATGRVSRTVGEFVTEAAFSGDGRRLAGLLNENAVVLDAAAWSKKKVVEMGQVASAFALSDDGALLATGHAAEAAGEVRLWRLADLKDVPAGKASAQVQAPAPAPAPAPALPSVREFICDSTQVTQETLLKEVVDGRGDKLVVRPTSQPCRYDLLYKEAGGKESVLSKTAGMFIVAAARKFQTSAGETVVVCASNIAHSRLAGNPGQAPKALNRRIDAAPIDCAAQVGGQWGPTATVLSGGPSWAAWVTGLSAVQDPGTFKLRFVRDSTFQFLNLADSSRPEGDGVYEAALEVARGRSPQAGSVAKVSDKVEPVPVRP